MSVNDVVSLPAEIAVALAGISPEDYWGMVNTIDAVLTRFGVKSTVRLNGKIKPGDGHSVVCGVKTECVR